MSAEQVDRIAASLLATVPVDGKGATDDIVAYTRVYDTAQAMLRAAVELLDAAQVLRHQQRELFDQVHATVPPSYFHLADKTEN